MRRTITMLLTAAAMLGAAGASGQPPGPEAQHWPHARDIPAPAPVAVGLAGGAEPDLVRYLMVRGARGPRISADGRTVAYLSDVSGEPQVWTVPAAGGWPEQRTFGSGVNGLDWTPDGGDLVYAADTAGDEREGFNLLSPDGARERVLLPRADAYRMFGGFSDDGMRFIYSSTERNGRDFDVHVGDVATGATRLVHEGHFGIYPVAWQPGGELVVLSEARGEDGADLHLLDLSTGEVAPLLAPGEPAANENVAFTPDGGGFYLVTNQDRDFRAIGHYDLGSGVLRIVEERDGHDLERLSLSRDGRWMGWTSNEDGYAVLHVRDLETGRMLPTPPLPRGQSRIAFARSAPVALILVQAPDAVDEVIVWNLESGETTRPVRTNWAGLDPADMVAPETVRFSGRDGTPLSGLFYAPKPASDGTRPPLLLMLHGGPTAQARPGWGFQGGVIQYLVARGIAVYDFNYRGSTGFGKAFAALNDRRLRLDELGDIEDAVEHLREIALVDPERAAAAGGSYGGYLTNAAVGAFPDLFLAGVSAVGVVDWVTALEQASPALKASDRVEYGDIDDPDDRAFFASISPINNIDRITTPLLVVHGVNDPRNPVSESDRLVEGVRGNGVEVVYLRFPDEGHMVTKVQNQVHMWKTVADFLAERFGMQAGR